MVESARISREGLFVILCAALFFTQLAISRTAYTAIQGILILLKENPMEFAHIQIAAQVAGTIASLFLPFLMERFSSKSLMVGTTIISCFAYLGMAFTHGNIAFLGGLAALMNSALVTSTSVSLFLMNDYFTNSHRSTLMSTYNVFYNLSLGMGPIAVTAFGVQDNMVFYFMIFVLAIGVSPLWFVKGRAHKIASVESAPLVRRHPLHSVIFLTKKPYVLLVVLIGCVNFGLFSYLLLFWGGSYNISLEKASLLPTVFAAGGALLSVPVGYLADRKGIEKVILGSIIVLMIAFVVLSLDHQITALDFMALFCVGGSIAVQFSLTFAVIGNAYSGSGLLTATAGYSVIRQFLSIFFIYSSGEILERFEAWGLNYTIIGFNALFIGGLAYLKIWSKRKVPHSSEQESASAEKASLEETAPSKFSASSASSNGTP